MFNWINVKSFTFKKTDGEDVMNPEILIYPVSAKDGYLICESPVAQVIKIYDVMGRLRKTATVGNNIKVDIRQFKSGVYVIKGESITQKIVL